jgi:protein gp37
MPDGQVAECYAKAITEKFGRGRFEQIAFHPDRLTQPLKVKKPAGIFACSVSDLFAHYVPTSQIEPVLDIVRRTPQHIYFTLTKNPVRLQHFTFPNNCWVGISSPPNFMWNKPLTADQQSRWLLRSLRELALAEARIKWMSIEPLSFDITPVLDSIVSVIGLLPLDWTVIGAASNGNVYYQPDPQHLRRLLEYLDDYHLPVFFKGNLRPSRGIAFDAWRESYPPLF